MATKKLKPVTPGSRHRVKPEFTDITTDKPERSLLKGIHKTSGRNNQGRMTSRHRGGGHKKLLRIIDFKRNKDNIPATVKTIEYDPNRTARIALVAYQDGEKRYIVAPDRMKVGDKIISGENVTSDRGNAMPLKSIPLGTTVHNVELSPGKGAQIVRSAGSRAQLVAKTEKYATLKLPSSEVRMVLITCRATVGTVSNTDHFNEVKGKAGRNRWKGRRPRTRAVAKNPVDHPMGGGEGKASGGHPRSPWGQKAKGHKTRRTKKLSDRYIVRRRKQKNKK